MIPTVVIFIIVLSLLVFVHEFGHFVAAKKSGVEVEEFGFGFPPRLFGVKRGKTTYSVNWIPLGGFVRLKGESGSSHDHDSFVAQKAWKRGVIIVAGVVMNFALTWVLLTVGFAVGMPQASEELPANARVKDEKVQVMSVVAGSPAQQAAIAAGDEILEVDGRRIASVEEFRAYTAGHEGSPITLAVRHAGETRTVDVTPVEIVEAGRAAIGVALVRTGIVSYPWYLAPAEGLRATYYLTREIFIGFGTVIHDALFGKKVAVELSGPVGIAVLTGEAARSGWRQLLQFTALLSANLGVINILPIPALDGGRLLFIIIERIRGRAVGRRAEQVTHSVGFAVLITLVLFITFRDLLKYGGTIIGAFTGG